MSEYAHQDGWETERVAGGGFIETTDCVACGVAEDEQGTRTVGLMVGTEAITMGPSMARSLAARLLNYADQLEGA